jgi:hypothetical protein
MPLPIKHANKPFGPENSGTLNPSTPEEFYLMQNKILGLYKDLWCLKGLRFKFRSIIPIVALREMESSLTNACHAGMPYCSNQIKLTINTGS